MPGGDAATMSRQRRRTSFLVVSVLSVALVGPVAYELVPRVPELGACRHLSAGGAPVTPAASAERMPPAVPADAQRATVVHVVDGDGICVLPTGTGPLAAGGVHEVRLIGMNAPGTGRCRSAEATAFARQRIGEGTQVFLSADQQDTDRYGRFLRYVWDADGDLVNVDAVRLGAARALVKPPNDRYADPIRAAEAGARRRNAGVWRCFPWRLLP